MNNEFLFEAQDLQNQLFDEERYYIQLGWRDLKAFKSWFKKEIQTVKNKEKFKKAVKKEILDNIGKKEKEVLNDKSDKDNRPMIIFINKYK